jgi:hypothetical protein
MGTADVPWWDYIEHSRPHNRRDVPGWKDIEHSRQHNRSGVPRLGGIYEIVFMMRAPNCRLLKWLKIASRKLQGWELMAQERTGVGVVQGRRGWGNKDKYRLGLLLSQDCHLLFTHLYVYVVNCKYVTYFLLHSIDFHFWSKRIEGGTFVDATLKGLGHQLNIFWKHIRLNQYFRHMRKWFYIFRLTCYRVERKTKIL